MADEPCGHYIGAEDRHCGAFPARRYLNGHRCADHTPARLAGQSEPGQGTYCPPRICYCGGCPTWNPALAVHDPISLANVEARRTDCHEPGYRLAQTVRAELTSTTEQDVVSNLSSREDVA